MRDSYDVVIVGGAVMGAAVAYFLLVNPDFKGSVLIIERDASFAQSSTSLSAASIRTHFSNSINVKMSQFGLEFIRDFSALMSLDGEAAPSLDFHEGGYLMLANNEVGAQVLRENYQVQCACGADIVLWDASELKAAFGHLHVEDIVLASYGRSGEGWFNNSGLMNGMRAKARNLGADYLIDEVVGVRKQAGQVQAIELKNGGEIDCGILVNAAGPRAGILARMAGISLPVEPRKRTMFVFDCAHSPEGTAMVNGGRLPLMVNPGGVWCRPEGQYFLCGYDPEGDEAVQDNDFEPRYDEFENVIWPQLAERSTAFEAIKLVNYWAGHYDFNVFDQNAIIGAHSEVRNFYFINGFSGHGLQQGPAAGRGLSELIIYGGYRSLDLSDLGFERIVKNRPFFEKEII